MTMRLILKMSDDELLLAAAPAYWGLMGVTEFEHELTTQAVGDEISDQWCEKCDKDLVGEGVIFAECPIPDPIPGPIEKVAFQMRDACVEKYWYSHLFFLGNFHDAEDAIKRSTAKQQVIAAVLAWEAG